jgi:hypothetical protein
MKTTYFTLFLLLFSGILKAQEYAVAPSGAELRESNFTYVRGTPFLYEEWSRGTVKMADSAVYNDLVLKFNALTNQLLYKNLRSGGLMEFLKPVSVFVLDKGGNRDLYRKGFPAVDKFNEDTFYQVISDGKVKLLYKQSKILTESRFYSSATSETNITDVSSYYILKDGRLKKIRPSKKEFIELFKDKENTIKAYLQAQDIDYKDKQSLANLVNYYNSL